MGYWGVSVVINKIRVNLQIYKFEFVMLQIYKFEFVMLNYLKVV